MPSHVCHRVVVTGANAGLGFETCKQLANKGVEKVILACRNEDRAKEAITKLVKVTSKPESTFGYLILNTSDVEQCRGAAETIDGAIDAVVLNAGGSCTGFGDKLNSSGANNIFTVNVLGHAAFTEGLIANDKLAAGARVMYAGSEASRGAAGVKAPTYHKTKEGMTSHMNGTGWTEYKTVEAYGTCKGIAALYMSALARKHPGVFFVTVSPGFTTGTSGFDKESSAVKILVKVLGPALRLFGVAHSAKGGAARYMSAIGYEKKGEPEFVSGKFYASPKGKVGGKLGDQALFFPLIDDVTAQDAAYEALHSFLDQAPAVM